MLPNYQWPGMVTVTSGSATAAFITVEPLPAAARPSADYISAYTLAQQSASGEILASTGVLVQTGHSSQHDMADGSTSMDTQMDAHVESDAQPQHDGHEHDEDGSYWFAATVVRQPGVARLTLFKDGMALTSFAAGGTAPVAGISPPTVGADAVDFAWTATDADGDPVNVSLQFSGDGGATWRSVASGVGSSSAHVTLAQLGGSTNGLARIIASDGFLTATATTEAFAVPMQPPSVVIQAPTAGATVLEGQPVTLQGYGLDPQDGTISQTTQLSWVSDRDGALGSGTDLYVNLSAGQHTLSLNVMNANGLPGTASVVVTVVPDYDGDGISDADEASAGLNPLTASDAYADTDGDGVSLAVERKVGTNPSQADSDGDGRGDNDELIAGTDPMAADAPLAPDTITLWPRNLALTVDLAQTGNLINEFINVSSRAGMSYTLGGDAPWLVLNQTAGSTPGGATLVINPLALSEGTNTATLRATGPNNTSTTPVVITVVNKQRFCDVNGDGVLNAADKALVEAQVGKAVGQPGYTFALDLTRDGVINAADVSAAGTCNSTPSSGGGFKLNLPLIMR